MHPASRAVPMAPAAKLAALRAEGGVPAAQPGRGDDRRRQTCADHRGQRVQPADQQRLSPGFGVPELVLPLFVAVDPLFIERVHERQHVLAGQQRRPPGQLREQLAVHRLQLTHVPPGIRAQVRAQRGRRPDPAEQHIHRPVPQQIHVVDTVRPADHPGDLRQPTFTGALTPHGPPACLLRDQLGEPGPLRQRHHRDQPGPRHEIRVIKRCVRPGQAMNNRT